MHRHHAQHSSPWAPDPYSPHTGDSRVRVLRYDLELACKLAGNRLDGTARLTLVPAPGVERIELDLVGLSVSRVTVDGSKVNPKHRHGRLSIPVPADPAGSARREVAISYGGNPGPRLGPWGDVGWEELEDGVLVAGQPDGASTWFPCNDTPSDKASYRVSITTDAGYRPVAPGRLLSHRRTSSRETWVYEQEAPTPAYLATLQIGRYAPYALPGSGSDSASGSGSDSGSGPDSASASHELSVLCTPQQKTRALAAFGRQADMVATFEAAYGPYPFEAYSCVVTEDPLEIPLEAQGLSIFGDNHLSPGWDNERLIAHELSHQWFGNSLTVKRWADLWLHEGFACYSEWLWSEASGSRRLVERARHAWEGLRDAPQDLVIGDPGPEDMFDDRVYKRGALTVLALRSELGEAAFSAALHSWTAQHRHGSVSREAFEEHLRAHAPAGTDPSAVLARWIDAPTLPAFPA